MRRREDGDSSVGADRADQADVSGTGLTRRALKRGDFRSKADLRDRILKFIDYFNRTAAKPYKWTYAGRPLNV